VNDRVVVEVVYGGHEALLELLLGGDAAFSLRLKTQVKYMDPERQMNPMLMTTFMESVV
jgi:hypothetical protein